MSFFKPNDQAQGGRKPFPAASSSAVRGSRIPGELILGAASIPGEFATAIVHYVKPGLTEQETADCRKRFEEDAERMGGAEQLIRSEWLSGKSGHPEGASESDREHTVMPSECPK